MKKFEAIYMLSEIAMRDGIYRYLTIKTGVFGREIGFSQQSTSRKLNELYSQGLIDKVVLIRGLKVKITKKGIDYLMDEIKKMGSIEEKIRRIIIEGSVTSGMGEGTYYMSREGYIRQFMSFFGERPYPGTLNILLDNEMGEIISFLKSNYRYRLNGFREMERTFGDVILHRATLNGHPCFIIFPERGHYENVVEIVSSENLRNKFSLKDGDRVKLEVFPYD
ncbi:MAG: DUF120 domain-containing protein [Thermoplasmata archaeon]|jgi:riboflavin kinase|nr:DUF120 domain-containing protein [Thermoplasmatales archaeon]